MMSLLNWIRDYLSNATIWYVLADQISDIKIMEFIACQYGSFWCIGLLEEIDHEQGDILVKFMHPHGPERLRGPQEKICDVYHLTNLCAKLMLQKQWQEECIK